MSKLARLSRLFDTGVELVLPTTTGDPEVVWVSKLNTFQTEECNHEGRVARSRRMFAIKEIGTPEYDLFQSRAMTTDADDLIKTLVDGKSNEFLFEVFQDIRSEEDWRDLIEVMEHSDDEIMKRPDDDPEKAAVVKISMDYQAEIMRRLEEARDDFRAELKDLSPALLRDRYREQYLEQEGLKAFQAARQTHELFYCLRDCEAQVPAGEAKWDHSKCDHSRKYLDEPSEVLSLPDEIVDMVRSKLQEVSVPTDLARFTAGPASSSESSGPSTSAEDSRPSSPEAPSQTPATTS